MFVNIVTGLRYVSHFGRMYDDSDDDDDDDGECC